MANLLKVCIGRSSPVMKTKIREAELEYGGYYTLPLREGAIACNGYF
jgi:hypothetical protein